MALTIPCNMYVCYQSIATVTTVTLFKLSSIYTAKVTASYGFGGLTGTAALVTSTLQCSEHVYVVMFCNFKYYSNFLGESIGKASANGKGGRGLKLLGPLWSWPLPLQLTSILFGGIGGGDSLASNLVSNS